MSKKMLDSHISIDKRFDKFSDTNALVFTWAIAHLDGEGTISADPHEIRSLVVPNRNIPLEDIESFIKLWLSSDPPLCSREGNRLKFLDFEKYNKQVLLNRERQQRWDESQKKLTLPNVRFTIKESNLTQSNLTKEKKVPPIIPLKVDRCVDWKNCKSDIQRLIAHYVWSEMPELYQKATQAQANGVFKRYGQAASDILAVAGDIETAKRAFDLAKAYFNEKELSWNLSSVAKNIAEFVNSAIQEKPYGIKRTN